jgi:hypothetical protein
MSDPLDDFLEFDAALGSEVVKCPACGEEFEPDA